MKTIAHYKKNPYLRTTENWIYTQIKYLKRFDPVVYCHGVCNRDLFPLERVRNVNMRANPAPALWEKAFNEIYFRFSLLRAIQQEHPDIVHAHFGPSGYAFLPFKRMFHLPMVTTSYGYDLSGLPVKAPFWRQRYQTLFKQGDMFLVEGNFMKRCLVKLGCDEEKVIVQHLGVDLDKIRFEPRQLKPGEDIRVLIAGHFREKKGIPYAIEAIAIFKQRQPQMKMKVTVIGDSTGQIREEREKKRILEAVKTHRLETEVNFLGYQSHAVFTSELYKNHIFLSPSATASDGDTEGGAPVSIIEASASGMPVLSTTHCDIPEVVISGEAGFLAPERDAGALADKLELVVGQANGWEQMGLKARAHIEEEYSSVKQSARLEDIYDQVISRKKI